MIQWVNGSMAQWLNRMRQAEHTCVTRRRKRSGLHLPGNDLFQSDGKFVGMERAAFSNFGTRGCDPVPDFHRVHGKSVGLKMVIPATRSKSESFDAKNESPYSRIQEMIKESLVSNPAACRSFCADLRTLSPTGSKRRFRFSNLIVSCSELILKIRILSHPFPLLRG
jgi:hypothetical protein